MGLTRPLQGHFHSNFNFIHISDPSFGKCILRSESSARPKSLLTVLYVSRAAGSNSGRPSLRGREESAVRGHRKYQQTSTKAHIQLHTYIRDI